MTSLSKIFIHIDINFSEIEKEYGKQYLENLIKSYADNLYRQNAKIDLYLVDGSLKIYITIIGVIYLAIGQYGSFRSGIDYLKKDTEVLSKIIVNDLQKNGLAKKKIIKINKNAGTISKISRLINRIDKFNQLDHSKDEYKNEIENILKYTQKIIYTLDDEQDINLFLNSVYELDSNHRIYNELPKRKENLIDFKNIFIRNNEEYEEYIHKLPMNDK